MTTQLLDTLELPGAAGPVDWDALSTDQVHEFLRGAFQLLVDREPQRPTDGVLQRSLQLEETLRAATPLQYRYTGLIKDGFDTPGLRVTLELPQGKTAFRDANDLLAKTHGIRANEAASRLKLAAAMTPARASDPDRADDAVIGQTRFPILSAFQGRINPTKLSSALSMIDAVDTNAKAAGKDSAYRAKLRTLIEKDFAEKIKHTTPEEFSRYVSQRKKDLLASVDPPDNAFTQAQTDAMYDVRRVGPVRGNKNAIEYRLVVDAEGDEGTQTLLSAINNPRAKDDENAKFDSRTAGQRKMHAIRDLIKFGLANMDKAGFRGASGAHTQMLVIADYATLLDGVRKELAELLPEIQAEKRAQLLAMLAEAQGTELANDDAAERAYMPLIDGSAGEAGVAVDAVESTQHPPASAQPQTIQLGDTLLTVPPPKTPDVGDILDDENLDRLQPRISQGIFTNYLPPDVILRVRCDVGITPITLTGQRQVLSIGRQQRQFSDALRRAILARDRGCAVPGCHWPASWCELHHDEYWSDGGLTSTDNGIAICGHHHRAVHVGALKITKVNGEFRFVLHPLIDPAQQPRKNYFYQS